MSDSGVMYVEPEEMTLRDYAAVLRRRKWLVVVPAVLATLIALGLSLSDTKMYRSTTEVLVKQPPSAATIGATEQPMTVRALQNELQRAQGSAMQDQVEALVGSEPTISVSLAAADDTDVFVFSAESRSPQRAAEAADAYADVYIEQRRQTITEELQARIEVLQERVASINTQLAAVPGGAASEQGVVLVVQREDYLGQLEALNTSIELAATSGAQVIDAARVPGAPFEPTPLRSAILALVVGLLIGLGAAFLADYLDNSLRDEDDLVKATGLPVLAVIPKLKDWSPSDTHVVTRESPSSPPAEAYRALRTSLQFLRVDRELNIVQITSPKPGDGKTTTSTNLAVACARAGQKVVLVDCDLRRPRVHHFFSLSNDVGFTSALMGATLDDVVQKVDGEPNLSVISSGDIPPDPSELLSGETSKRFIASLAERFDLVVIDSPPVLVVSDPLILSASAHGVILVASAANTDRRQVARAAEQLAQIEAPMLGTVLNAFDPKGNSAYEYRYAYGQYESTKS